MVSILHREMRIASRRKWTFRIRVLTSVGAFFCGIGLTLLSSQSSMSGNYLFSALVFFSFFFCLVQGVRRASANIAEEKRDGTLGLLFLTDLRPIDIIMGKLFSIAIPLVQPLLAFVPVLAISILLGGTTGGEVFRAALVLASILVYSISAGLFVSSFSRKSEETGQGTLALLLATLLLPRLFAWGKFRPLRFLSPWTAYANIPDPGYRVNAQEYWLALAVVIGISALLLAAAAFFLPRRWQDKEVVSAPKMVTPRKRRISDARRATLLDRNPGEWLATRHSAGAFETWFFRLAIFALIACAGVVSAMMGSADVGGALALLAIATLLVFIRLASQASFSLAEARRSGAIEMLLSTPLHPRRLITGQIAMLRRNFLPVISLMLIAAVSMGMFDAFSGPRAMTAWIAVYCVVLVVMTLTVASVGMWMGLREKNPNAAFFKTVLFTVIIPFFGSCFWFITPIAYLVMMFVAMSRLHGKRLERLLKNEPSAAELTPVAPIVAAPPVIMQQR
jgi:ABC-type Na+ efflux pump permease subunit